MSVETDKDRHLPFPETTWSSNVIFKDAATFCQMSKVLMTNDLIPAAFGMFEGRQGWWFNLR
jgi:hypothetical protein